MKKHLLCTAFMSFMLLSAPMTAFAGKQVNNVTLQLEEHIGEAGEMPDTNVTANSDAFDISSVVFSPEQNSWYPGKKVTVTVTVDANDGYSFNKSKTKVSVNGGITKNVSENISSGHITYRFNYSPRVQLPAPTNIHFGELDDDTGFDDYVAKWDKVDYAKYEVKVFEYVENDSGDDTWKQIKTVTVTKPEIDLSQYATSNGAIRFDVRSVAKNADNDNFVLASKWVNSEDMEITSDLNNTARGDFTNNNGNLTFNDTDSKPVSGWQYINNYWYYFDPLNQNIAAKGFVAINNNCYFFDQDGRMQTGWQCFNGVWYYFTQENSNEIGIMRLGWYQVKPNVWYYFEYRTNQPTPWGGMVANNLSPDGYWLNADGTWYATH